MTAELCVCGITWPAQSQARNRLSPIQLLLLLLLLLEHGVEASAALWE